MPKLYQPNFSDGETDIRGGFLVLANDAKEAEKQANEWFHKQETNLQHFFAPLSGTVAITEMVEIKPNSLGIVILPC